MAEDIKFLPSGGHCAEMDMISEHLTELLKKHQLGELVQFAIQDAGERLWLVPDNGKHVLEYELDAHFREFFHSGKCRVGSRVAGFWHFFFLVLPECVCNTQWHRPKERSLVILNTRSGILRISGCSPFAVRGILRAFNSCVGGVEYAFQYDLQKLFWSSRLPIPENWPLLRIELAGYSLLCFDRAQLEVNVSRTQGDLWAKLQLHLRSPAEKAVLKMLRIRVVFHDKTTRTYRVFEEKIDAGVQDARRKTFSSYLALLAVPEVKHE